MKNVILITSLIFIIFHKKSINSQYIKVEDPISVHEKYKCISKLDTIKIITYEKNCVGCVDNRIIMFYENDELNIVFEDSFTTLLQIVDNVASTDSLKLLSLIKKIKDKPKL